jgi:hypothetical protein
MSLPLAVGCFAEMRNLHAVEDLGGELLRACLEVFSQLPDALMEPLFRELAPSMRAVGPAWPGRAALTDWLEHALPTLTRTSFYADAYALGMLLGSVGSGLPGVLDALRQLSQRLDTGMLCAVAHTLSEYRRGEPAQRELLQWFLGAAPEDIARAFALRYLGEQWREDPSVMETLLRAADDPSDRRLQSYALSVLYEFHPADDATLDLALRAASLHTPDLDAMRFLLATRPDDPRTRGVLRTVVTAESANAFDVASALRLFAASSDEPEIEELTRDAILRLHDSFAVGAVIDVLVSRFGARPGTAPLLAELALSGSPEVVVPATKALGSIAANEHTRRVLSEMLETPHPGYYDLGRRSAALEALAIAFGDDVDTVAMIVDVANGKYGERLAIEAVKALEAERVVADLVVPPLLDLLSTDDAPLRETVKSTLARRYATDPRTAAWAAQAAGSTEPATRVLSVELLAADEAAFGTLISLGRSDPEPVVRVAVLNAIRFVFPSRRELFELLLEALERTDAEREVAIAALEMFAGAAPVARALGVVAAHDENPAIRLQAIAAAPAAAPREPTLQFLGSFKGQFDDEDSFATMQAWTSALDAYANLAPHEVLEIAREVVDQSDGPNLIERLLPRIEAALRCADTMPAPG